MNDFFDVLRGSEVAVRVGPTTDVRSVRHGDLELDFRSTNQIGVILNLSSTHRLTGEMDEMPNAPRPAVGLTTIMPPKHRFRFQVSGQCRVVALRFPMDKLQRILTESDGSGVDLMVDPCVNVDDPALARLILLAAAAVTHSAQEDGLVAVARYLATNVRRPLLGASDGPVRGGMAPARLRRIVRTLEENLDAPWTLAALANEAGMSAYHFARAFATTTGWPPHRFVMRRRIHRAVELLGDETLSIGDIAERLGFAHHSHLARTMRRFIGLTPDVLRTRVFA
ncbi:helix-turn-helix domain-containing protein [Burkholderia cenocepacia]|uniref:helix-turn-helix domain-containing protein n=1 Tax=Burkholderia cenocepacia TaxID=95486 RepID=UPI00163995C9|nr:AraC family transcriptional regulator [Burkholderia cenocepacia]